MNNIFNVFIHLQVFHPAFRDQCVGANGMEVDQITSLVSIFSFGQQVFNNTDSPATNTSQVTQSSSVKKRSKDEDDSDSDSDTSSDSGHSSDDHETNNDEARSDTETRNDTTAAAAASNRSDTNPDLQTCLAQAKDKDLEVSTGCVTAAV